MIQQNNKKETKQLDARLRKHDVQLLILDTRLRGYDRGRKWIPAYAGMTGEGSGYSPARV